jgi:small-conductance mechanosensitive channel
MLNLPVPAYTKGMDVREMIEAMWMPRLEEFKPEMIFISAGFDAHREDDLGQLGLVENDYAWITQRIKDVARRHARGRIGPHRGAQRRTSVSWPLTPRARRRLQPRRSTRAPLAGAAWKPLVRARTKIRVRLRFRRRAVSSTDLSMRKVASNAVRAILLLVGLLFALSAVGVDLTALSVLGGALGVGLGFGLQKLAANYVSGFVILLERSIRIGDNVKVDTFEGRITDIKTRYTLIRAGNGREAIVPNESLITSRVENLSMADRKFNITTSVVVGYDSDVAQVQSILCGAAKSQPRVMTDPEPVTFLASFAPDGLEFVLNFWVADPDKGKDNVRSAINIAILEGLRGAGVDIPYPQRVLRVESLPPGVSGTRDAAV